VFEQPSYVAREREGEKARSLTKEGRRRGAERRKEKKEEEGSELNKREFLRGLNEERNPATAQLYGTSSLFNVLLCTVCTFFCLFSPHPCLSFSLPLSFPLHQQLPSARRQSWLLGLLNCPHFSGFVRSRGKMKKE